MRDASLQRKLLGTFLGGADRLANDFAKASSEGGAAYADSLHRLCGSAQFVCATRLISLLRRLEDERVDVSAADRARDAELVAQELGTLRSELTSALDGLGQG